MRRNRKHGQSDCEFVNIPVNVLLDIWTYIAVRRVTIRAGPVSSFDDGSFQVQPPEYE